MFEEKTITCSQSIFTHELFGSMQTFTLPIGDNIHIKMFFPIRNGTLIRIPYKILRETVSPGRSLKIECLPAHVRRHGVLLSYQGRLSNPSAGIGFKDQKQLLEELLLWG
ncbi:MAG TPA: hypothetical protein VGE63_01230 [Candidatus Paceibacterota bacterium]